MAEVTQSRLVWLLFFPHCSSIKVDGSSSLYLQEVLGNRLGAEQVTLVLGLLTFFSKFAKGPHGHFSIFRFSPTLP